MSVNEKMTALADKIRAKLNITNKLGLDEMIESIDPIYELGYEVGKSEGGGDNTALAGLIDGSATELSIPNGVTQIREYALYKHPNISSIIIPEGVTDIGKYAFRECGNLSYAKIANTVKSIGDSAFYDTNLEYIDIPDGVTSIDGACFSSCPLKSIVIPDSVTSTLGFVFQRCTNLETAVIGSGVTDVGSGCFAYCSNLKSVIFRGAITKIRNSAFKDCSNCLEYDFSNCTSIPTMSFADSFDGINSNAKIIVPPHLYNDWIKATNWTTLVKYIVKADMKAIPNEDNFSIYVDANTLKEIADYSFFGKKAVKGISHSEVLYDGEVPFIRMYGDGSSAEAYAQVQNIEGTTTGKYLVFAYRYPTTNTENHNHFQVYANTTGDAPTGQGDFFELVAIKDGKWHAVVIDLEQAILNYADVITGKYASKFVANAGGTYDIGRLRIDFFNRKTSTESYIDVAYVGICDTIEKAVSADTDYDGAEWNAKDLSSAMGESLLVDEYGVEYVHIEANTGNYTEKFVELRNAQRIVPNVGRYVGILFKNAPGGFTEIYASSNTAEWLCSSQYKYAYKDEYWRYGVVELNSGYVDSVCRRFRFDYFNGVSKNTTYSIDIGFIKCFASEEEANEYYTRYKLLNNIPDAPFYVPM